MRTHLVYAVGEPGRWLYWKKKVIDGFWVRETWAEGEGANISDFRDKDGKVPDPVYLVLELEVEK